MSDISKIDKNFVIKTSIEKEGIKFYDCDNAPFLVHGIFREGEKYVRLPHEVAATVNDGVKEFCSHTVGGRVRFVTDSKYVAINAVMGNICRMSHMALTGFAGFDIYADDVYVGTYMPPYDVKDGYESIKEFPNAKKRVITINFPCFSEVKNLYIGLDSQACLEPAPQYKISKPVVFYGSSITHGGCVSRPGNTYEAAVSRRFGMDYVNLGFSGSARAEETITNYIKKLDMSLFVYDYDHNAPSPEYLAQTHEKMFLAIREVQPELPVIIMSRPRYIQNEDTIRRLEIIKTTYKNAIARGDKNVYMINGRELMGIVMENGTVDDCHPNDSGFWNMAKRLGDEIEDHYKEIFG